MSSMALSGETFRKMAAQKNALLMRLAAAEHSADMSAPSKIAFRSGTLYTSQFVIGTLNGYFGNPKVAGLVGYDFVGGMTIHTLGLLARYFAPKITDTVGDTGMAVAHTVADARCRTRSACSSGRRPVRPRPRATTAASTTAWRASAP